jgi:deazaflavin-dependent oxidoreductase (nitroreductase family)
MANPFAGSAFYARLGNVFTRPLWSTLPAPPGFGILTTVGRRTGKPRKQSVRAIRRGDVVFVVCMMGERTQWLNNIRANPAVTIRLRDETLHGNARPIVDAEERRRAAEAYVATTGWSDYTDYVAYHWGVPTRAKIERAHRRWFEEGIPVVIELDHRR